MFNYNKALSLNWDVYEININSIIKLDKKTALSVKVTLLSWYNKLNLLSIPIYPAW